MLKVRDWLKRPAFKVFYRNHLNEIGTVTRLKDGKPFHLYWLVYSYKEFEVGIDFFYDDMIHVQAVLYSAGKYKTTLKIHIDDLITP